jgi:anti-sigma regulatory factor (Ser/Thr protein kinase)
MDSLTLPASLDSLSPLRQYVEDAAKDAGLNKEATYKLKLIVDEIATNIISYGYGESDPPGDITIDKEVIGNKLRITLVDTGVEFDPRKRKLPDEEELSKPLGERQIGGLGIFLTMRDVDIFDYKRVGNRNYNIFEMYIKDRT